MKGETVLWQTVDQLLGNGASAEDIAFAIENFLALKKELVRQRKPKNKRARDG